MGQKFVVLGDWKGKILKINVETPLGNQSPPKHVIQCKKYNDPLQNVCFRAWQEKYKKIKQSIFKHYSLFPPFAPPALLGRFLSFLAGRVAWPTLSSKSNFKSIDSGVWELQVPKISGFPLTLIVALTTPVLCTTGLHCEQWKKCFAAFPLNLSIH